MNNPLKISGDEIKIPLKIAIKICDEIMEDNKKHFNFLGNQCLGCIKFSKGDYKKKLFTNNPDNNGCYLINVRYLKEILI